MLEVTLDEQELDNIGVQRYYSAGLDDSGHLNVGSERGIAFLAKGDTIAEANGIVEQAVSHVNGRFYYRHDIGSSGLIEEKRRHVEALRGNKPHFRTAHQGDFLAVHRFVASCQGLERYAEHFYKIMLRYFGEGCYIAEQDGEIIGWILGFKTYNAPGTYFLWQIGIKPGLQGRGIGRSLLRYAEKEIESLGCSRIELTIDPENTPSQKLFEKSGYSNISEVEGETVSVNGNIAVKDHYSPGRHFMVYEKQLTAA